jgi:hypothetical protein
MLTTLLLLVVGEVLLEDTAVEAVRVVYVQL